MDVADPVAGGQQFPVGAEGQGRDPVGVLGEGVQELSVFGRKDLHDLAGAADRHLPLVGRDVGGQHRIGLIADR